MRLFRGRDRNGRLTSLGVYAVLADWMISNLLENRLLYFDASSYYCCRLRQNLYQIQSRFHYDKTKSMILPSSSSLRFVYETDFVALNSCRIENENLSERVTYRFVPGMTREERSEIMIELSHYAKIGDSCSLLKIRIQICTQAGKDAV